MRLLRATLLAFALTVVATGCTSTPPPQPELMTDPPVTTDCHSPAEMAVEVVLLAGIVVAAVAWWWLSTLSDDDDGW